MSESYKSRNPSNKIGADEIIRFRGITIARNEQMTPSEYVESCDNLVSFKLRELTVRSGQTRKETRTGGITSGRKTLTQVVSIGGPSLYSEPITDTLTPVETTSWVPPITNPSFGLGVFAGTVYLNTDVSLIGGVLIELRNIPGGPVIATATTDVNGNFVITGLTNAYYHVTASKAGYETFTYTMTTTVGLSILMCLTLAAGEARMTLTWGVSPMDLDLHLAGQEIGPTPYHCYYDNSIVAGQAELDIDDTTSYGPETISIFIFNPGTYRIFVHDFTNRALSSSSVLGRSGAVVTLYIAGGTGTSYAVPELPGTLWEIATITVEGATVTVVNELTYHEDPDTIGA